TAFGTQLVADINPGAKGSLAKYFTNITNFNGSLFFSANDGVHGFELWRSNGASAGTALLADINPGAPQSDLFNFTNMGGTLFFSASDGTNGSQIWRSNGTAAGASIVTQVDTSY